MPPAATFGLKRVLPFCAILLLTFGLVSTLTVGDGYHITAQGNLRLASINNINSIMIIFYHYLKFVSIIAN